jgi:ribose transport system substrate-binding protein
MVRMGTAAAGAFGIAAALTLFATGSAVADDSKLNGDGGYVYKGAPRTFLWNPQPNQLIDTSKYKKNPPYVIGFSNASISNVWRVGFANALYSAASANRNKIKRLIVTDANDSPAKQVADIQDLIQQGVDILIVSAATAEALDPIVTRAMKQGIPVVMVDRRVTSESFVSFVTSNNIAAGRIYAQWIVEKLNYKGNVIMLPGIPGAGSSQERVEGAMEVFSQYPSIKILDTQYTDFSQAKGKTVAAAMIQKFGKSIDAIWSIAGGTGTGALEAFIDAGYKDGEIPVTVCGDINSCLLLSIKHKIPAINIDYPSAMGGIAIKVALDVLSGTPVPHTYQANADIMVTKGDETASVKADQWVEDYAQPDKPYDYILDTGLGKNYDPSTFKPDYPR